MENNEIYNQLQQVDWKTMRVSLLRFANKHVGDDRNGRTPEDLVQDAIEKTFQGAISESTRRWGIRIWDGQVDLFTFLCGVIKSQGSNHLRAQDHQNVSSLQPLLEHQNGSPSDDPAHSYQSQEWHSGMREALRGNESLEKFWQLLLRGYQPAEIATELEIPIALAYRWKRRLKKLAHKIIHHKSETPTQRPSLLKRKR